MWHHGEMEHQHRPSHHTFGWLDELVRRSLTSPNGRVRGFLLPAFYWVGFDDIVGRGIRAATDLAGWAFEEADAYPEQSADAHLAAIICELECNAAWSLETRAAFDWFCSLQPRGPIGTARIKAEGRRLKVLTSQRYRARSTLFQYRQHIDLF